MSEVVTAKDRILKRLDKLREENENESELLRQLFSAEISGGIPHYWQEKYEDILNNFFKALRKADHEN